MCNVPNYKYSIMHSVLGLKDYTVITVKLIKRAVIQQVNNISLDLLMTPGDLK